MTDPSEASRSEPWPRSRAFVLLRFVLIIATSYLLLAQNGRIELGSLLPWILGTALVSNLVLMRLPSAFLDLPMVIGSVVVADTVWITAALLVSGQFSADFFYVYFFVLFMAGIGESLPLIALGAAVICFAYLVAVARGGSSALWTTSSLIRIPFLIAVAAFYGYLVDCLRRERQRAQQEALSVDRLQVARRELAEFAAQAVRANRKLEWEIAERKRAERQLRTLSLAVEESPSIVLIADAGGLVEYVNPRFAAVTGHSSQEVVGQPLAEVLRAHGCCADGGLPGAIRDRDSWRGELERSTGQGAPQWTSVSLTPIHDADGVTTHLVAVLDDITEIKRAEATLRRANNELQRLSEIKSEFISTVSHELRTPLTAVANTLEILESEAGNAVATRSRFLEIARRNVARLTSIVNDLLDISRIEAGKLSFHFGKVDVAELLDNLAASFEAQARTAGVTIEVCCAPTVPPAWADPHRLEQILTNLVGNALKFTPAGGLVTLAAQATGERLELAVADTGVGMSSEVCARIFEPFYQAESAELVESPKKGSGLGLAIARDLVRAHGGELGVESSPGKGSRFFFQLELATPAAIDLLSFEAAVRDFKRYPVFSVLLVAPAAGSLAVAENGARGALLDTLEHRLGEALPRSSDLVCRQLGFGRFVIVLLGTDRSGAGVVRARLEAGFESRPLLLDDRPQPPPVIHGPAVYPEDGRSGRRLLDLVLRAPEPEILTRSAS